MIPLLIGFLLLILIGHDIIVGRIESNRPTYYESGDSFPLDNLPPSAREVHFRNTAAFDAWGRSYEFECTEQDFRDWVAKARNAYPKLSPIRREASYALPVILKDGSIDSKLARDVLISDWTYTDLGQYYVYDPSRGRAITWSHSR